MQHKKVLSVLLLLFSLLVHTFALQIKQNDLRIFTSTANDKFSYALAQNKDDQFTASFELHFILPYLFIDINDNSITNRTFPGGRYDELILKTGTTLTLFDTLPFELTFTPQAGFCLLGNFGMEFAQNLNHKVSNVDEVKLEYEHFKKPFAPLINAQASFAYILPQAQFIKLELDLTLDNIIFYSTEQKITANAKVGTKTTFNIFAGYKWTQTHINSPVLKAYKKETTGFNYGFNLDTGFLKLDFITYPQTKNGNGTISVDFMNLQKHNWQQSDLHFFTGMCFIIDTEFLENQVQTPQLNNFSIYISDKYVSGFKTNKANPSEYRYLRNYEIITMGIKYEQPLEFLQNWVTPYVELGTGIAMFGVTKLANHLPQSTFDSYEYEAKAFFQMQANIGLDIIPQGMLNFGSAAYSFTVYAGTIFIPQYKKATKQIKLDTYRTAGWQLHPFEFTFGFALHMGLDF